MFNYLSILKFKFMKKLVISFVFLLAFGAYSSAQVSSNALGIRFGGGDFLGGELSYQRGLGSSNRLELDLGFSGNSNKNNFYLAGIYQWNWNIAGGFNWFLGPGATIGYQNWDDDGRFNLAVGGQLGIEYNFKAIGAPILLSLDTRPMWSFVGHTGFGWGVDLGLRYVW